MAYELQGYRRGIDPFGAMEAMENVLRQIQGRQRQQGESGAIVPLAEAIEDENSYILAVEIPGVDPQQVEVSVVGSTLTVKAERHRHAQEAQPTQQGGQQGQSGQQRSRHYLFSELPHGVIRREFGLPDDADRNQITAEFRYGLLVLTLPKSQESQHRRRIEVRAS